MTIKFENRESRSKRQINLPNSTRKHTFSLGTKRGGGSFGIGVVLVAVDPDARDRKSSGFSSSSSCHAASAFRK